MLTLLTLLIALSPAAPDQPGKPEAPAADALKRAAATFVARLAAGDFAGAAEGLEKPYAARLTPEKLRQTWQDLVRRGPYQAAGEPRLELRPTGNYVYVPCRFGTREHEARLLFNDRNEIAYVVFIPASLDGPGLIRASAGARCLPAREGAAGTITFPIPGTYRDQVPLSFAVTAKPAEALRGYRWRRRDGGRNWVCEVRVAPPRDGAAVRWEALVLVGKEPAGDLPPAKEPEAPEAARPWTRPTGCVQSDDPAIRARAEELARGADGVADYARKVMAFTAGNRGTPGAPFRTLDAREALGCGGSCTSRANLAAALLRARGIPARTLAHLPTWCGPLYEHWLVEYWHPGAGWVWLETSLNRFRPPSCGLVVLNVANPDDEDRAFRDVRLRGVVPGAPEWSVHELSDELRPNFQRDPDEEGNLATPEVRLRGGPEEIRAVFAAAREAYRGLVRAGEAGAPSPKTSAQLLAAAGAGSAGTLADELRQPERPGPSRPPAGQAADPTAQALFERHAREKAPVWADGDRATFFFRGEAEEVSLFVAGEMTALHRVGDVDVWTTTVERPGLSKGVFTYLLLPHKKGEPPLKPGQNPRPASWRGPEAPPAPAVAEKLKGTEKAFEFPSKALGATRTVRVYLPPGHDRGRPTAVIYATDGQLNADLLEPLIEAGTLRPVLVVGAESGGYLDDPRAKGAHDLKHDLRAMEYLPGIDPERFARHEKFFCEELPAWAEREFGASKGPRDRAVFGCSNGARFAVEMGVRHPDRFGQVFAFSVAGLSNLPAAGGDNLPRFFLAAGRWENGCDRTTKEVTDKLRKRGASVEMHLRYAGHDDTMWRDEFAAAVREAFAR